MITTYFRKNIMIEQSGISRINFLTHFFGKRILPWTFKIEFIAAPTLMFLSKYFFAHSFLVNQLGALDWAFSFIIFVVFGSPRLTPLEAQYVYQDSKLLAAIQLWFWYIPFLSDWSGQKSSVWFMLFYPIGLRMSSNQFYNADNKR